MGRAERREGQSVTDESPGVGSGTLTPDAFNQMITDASAFSLTLDSGTRNAIQWIAAKDSILIGTTGGEWSLSGHTRDKPITPTSYNIRDHTKHGSKDLPPILLSDGYAFVNYVGRKLFKLDYDGLDEDYTANELSILAEHITDSGIVDMAFQRNPDPILWAIRADGTLLSMTYDPKQDVVAWARHPFDEGSAINSTDGSQYVTNTAYPTLRTTTDQADLGLTQETAIHNITELQNIANDLTGNYYFANNIDASDTVNWNSGAGFDPIGTFRGTLDGNSYTVSNLFINRATENDVGLFSYASTGSSIANLTLASCDITGKYDTGALAGRFAGTVIQNCHVTGSVSGQYYVGGLIGRMTTGSVYDSDSSCTVLGLSGASMSGLGGLIGRGATGTVSNCYSTGNVTGTTGHVDVGGFIGHSDGGAIVSYCYATGDVTGNEAAGFVCVIDSAGASGSFQKCYATGNVYGIGAADALVAGFVRGISTINSSVTDCYSWGDCSSSAIDAAGAGFVAVAPSWFTFTNCYSTGRCDLDNPAAGATNPSGFAYNEGNVTDCVDCFWDTETSGISVSDGGTGHITSWMQTESNYPSTWDFDTIWQMPTPVLWTDDADSAIGINSVAVIPSTTEDEVWLGISRVIDGSVVRYIERMKSRDWGDDMEDMFFVDSGLTYDSTSTSSITGLDHLEGETVAILADGAVQPTKTVSSGAITLTDAASVVQVGLPYTYKLKPMRMDQNTQGGTTKGSVKKITEAVISFYKTLNARYGDGTDTYDINWRETSAEYTTPPDLVTDDKVVVADGGFKVDDPFQIEGSDPMPCSVRAIIPRIDQTGR